VVKGCSDAFETSAILMSIAIFAGKEKEEEEKKKERGKEEDGGGEGIRRGKETY